MRMTATDTFHTGHGCVSGNLEFVAESMDVAADSSESVFMTVSLLTVPDALLTSLDLVAQCEQP